MLAKSFKRHLNVDWDAIRTPRQLDSDGLTGQTDSHQMLQSFSSQVGVPGGLMLAYREEAGAWICVFNTCLSSVFSPSPLRVSGFEPPVPLTHWTSGQNDPASPPVQPSRRNVLQNSICFLFCFTVRASSGASVG